MIRRAEERGALGGSRRRTCGTGEKGSGRAGKRGLKAHRETQLPSPSRVEMGTVSRLSAFFRALRDSRSHLGVPAVDFEIDPPVPEDDALALQEPPLFEVGRL